MDSLENLCERFPDQAHTAFREAGHAVAAAAFGWSVAAVYIGGDRPVGQTWLFPSPSEPRICRERMIYIAAGPVAASFYDPYRPTGDDDTRDALDMARRLVGLLAGEAPAVREFAIAQQRARRLILDHWPEVEQVALSLLRHHFVTRSIRPFVGDLAALDEAPYNPITIKRKLPDELAAEN